MVATFFDILAGIAVLIGAFFVLAAAVGVVRMPDVYVRMHAATKTGTLGSGLMLIGVAVHSGEADIITRALAAVVFLIATTPVAAHLLGRAAYVCGVPTWRGTWIDELKGRYDPETYRLSPGDELPHDDNKEAKSKD